MDNKNSLSQHNRKQYETQSTINYYIDASYLTQAELQILQSYRSDYERKRVLDLGVGTGRTTQPLAAVADVYVGIDYSSLMIDACRKRFPQYRFEHGDARDLSRFAPASFDFVLFSFNGIDLVGDRERRRVLREVTRVLAPGGLFVFSTHSLETADQHAGWRKLIPPSHAPATPLKAFKRLCRTGLRAGNYLRHRAMQERCGTHAVLLDPGHNFTIPIYHVTASEQRRQLLEAGFAPAFPTFPEYASDDPLCRRPPYALYYAARKNRGPSRFDAGHRFDAGQDGTAEGAPAGHAAS